MQAKAGSLNGRWGELLQAELDQEYMSNLRRFLLDEKARGKTLFPPGEKIFESFNLTPFERVKLVMIGQDPYHGPGQAHGLCFSVLPGVKTPPSLVNIYKELNSDLGLAIPQHGFLQAWAEQGVLLLNSVLTVEQAQAGSHQGKGWERFTDRAIALLNEQRENLVFILWGSYAQKKGQLLDQGRHLVLSAPHPSPLSAHRGFFGSRPFSQANAYLEKVGLEPIDWQL